jgi:hypothetical protein
MEYVDGKEKSQVKFFRTNRYHAKSSRLQTLKNFKKCLQGEKEQIKNTIAQNIKENRKKKRCIGNSHRA